MRGQHALEGPRHAHAEVAVALIAERRRAALRGQREGRMRAVRRHAQLHRSDVGFERVLERCEHQPLGQRRGAVAHPTQRSSGSSRSPPAAPWRTRSPRSVSFVELGQPLGRRADPVQPAQPPHQRDRAPDAVALPAAARRRDALAQTHRHAPRLAAAGSARCLPSAVDRESLRLARNSLRRTKIAWSPVAMPLQRERRFIVHATSLSRRGRPSMRTSKRPQCVRGIEPAPSRSRAAHRRAAACRRAETAASRRAPARRRRSSGARDRAAPAARGRPAARPTRRCHRCCHRRRRSLPRRDRAVLPALAGRRRSASTSLSAGTDDAQARNHRCDRRCALRPPAARRRSCCLGRRCSHSNGRRRGSRRHRRCAATSRAGARAAGRAVASAGRASG